jgi:hypothetical protein
MEMQLNEREAPLVERQFTSYKTGEPQDFAQGLAAERTC